MTLNQLNMGDVFRVVGQKQLWCRVGASEACSVSPSGTHGTDRVNFKAFSGKKIELVERGAEIGRLGDMLVLRGGEVTLDYNGAMLVHRCTPGEPFTEIAFGGDSYPASRVKHPTEQTALMFSVVSGSAHLGRGKGSELFAYGGRIYVRATHKEVTGQHKPYGYKRVLKIDGARRMIVMGLPVIPNEFSLYDIMMEHFGPDTVPR